MRHTALLVKLGMHAACIPIHLPCRHTRCQTRCQWLASWMGARPTQNFESAELTKQAANLSLNAMGTICCKFAILAKGSALTGGKCSTTHKLTCEGSDNSDSVPYKLEASLPPRGKKQNCI